MSKQLAKILAQIIDNPFDGRGLTAAETRASNLAAHGMTYQEIADELKITAQAVGNTLLKASKKIGVHPRQFPNLLIKQIQKQIKTYSH